MLIFNMLSEGIAENIAVILHPYPTSVLVSGPAGDG
jgi:hypothetical protein